MEGGPPPHFSVVERGDFFPHTPRRKEKDHTRKVVRVVGKGHKEKRGSKSSFYDRVLKSRDAI